MSHLDQQWAHGLSRRKALAGLGAVLAGSPLLHAQLDPRPRQSHTRAPGLNEMLISFDFEPVMFSNVPLSVYDYTAHGDGGEYTLRRNREAFDWVSLRPGKAVAPASVNLSSQLFDLKLEYPILIAPTAAMVPLHPDGEAGMYQAGAASANTPCVLSHNSSQPVEQVAKAARGQLWWQFYPQQDLNRSREMIERAQNAGYTAIVVTVDQQASYYERTLQNRNLGGNPRVAPGPRSAAATPASGAARYRVNSNRLWYTWQYLDDIRKFVKGPLLVKGIMTAEDATLCVERGVNGIIVSNHGGRSMDYGPSTIEALPEIVAAVNRRMPIIVDSGFRRGTDVLKALALGANAVMLGRPTRWALAAFGPAGVERLLKGMIFPELVDAAAAAGKTTLASIDSSIIRQTWP